MGDFPDCLRGTEAEGDRSDAACAGGMRARSESRSARGCVHAGTNGKHAGVFDGDDGFVRGDYPDADGGLEGRGETAWEGDYAAGKKSSQQLTVLSRRFQRGYNCEVCFRIYATETDRGNARARRDSQRKTGGP